MNDEHKETARELGLPEDDPAVMRDLQMLASSGAGQAPQWGLRAGQPRPVGKVNRLAVFALFCSFILPVLGIVFGTLALNEIEDGGGKERGAGVARSAIALGIIYLIAAVVAIALVISAIRGHS